MLPKNRRLTRQQFWQVYQKGISIQGVGFSVKFLVNDVGYSRWAIVTSTKLSKKAVVRNKLRRQIYRQLSTVNCPLSIDAIIFPRPTMLNLDDAKISTAVNQVVSKIFGLA